MGLAVSRAIHDRYDAALRNPYNEIECSDHYARAMASYGVFQAVCGFNCHGPRGHIEFAPRLVPEDFRAAFVTAGGWGTFRQTRSDASEQPTPEGRLQTAELAVMWGEVRLQTLGLVPGSPAKVESVTATLDDTDVRAVCRQDGDRVTVMFDEPVVVAKQSILRVALQM
jgi:hypothetical protein